MSRKVCTSGVKGPFTFLILDTDKGSVVATIQDESDKISATHTDMALAEKWTNRELRTLIGKRYEVD